MRTDLEQLKRDLMIVDRSFSQFSVEKGTVAAFHHFMADSGLVLPRDGQPRSRAQYAELLALVAEKSRASTLTWEPLLADVAASGDLGYTHGRYQLTFADSTQPPLYGYYVTIWKKQADGQWRFVFDAGNQAVAVDDHANSATP